MNAWSQDRAYSSYRTTAYDLHPAIGLSYGQLVQSGQNNSGGDVVGVSLIDNIYLVESAWAPDVGIGIQRLYLQDGSQPAVATFSIDARYILPHRWSVGPAADVFLNNGSMLGSSNSQALFIGAVGYHEFNLSRDEYLKLGLKANTQFLVGGQSSNYIGLAVDLSIPSPDIMANR